MALIDRALHVVGKCRIQEIKRQRDGIPPPLLLWVSLLGVDSGVGVGVCICREADAEILTTEPGADFVVLVAIRSSCIWLLDLDLTLKAYHMQRIIGTGIKKQGYLGSFIWSCFRTYDISRLMKAWWEGMYPRYWHTADRRPLIV
ncbi:uncharacterized protein RSE6_01472 [Rhynchosporium secalis]|uniref:Uncharacterized protein n=1 Tax=Rhynchosporium secalis TaxID=38038 RepID=A0A1E1LXZ1_RHYSE|nr:uncharacterized protein RSE6_01472 [Rhynchosporium secalis]